MGNENCLATAFWLENFKERLGVDGRIIFKLILEKYGVKMYIRFS
jgi:hypothetical protein